MNYPEIPCSKIKVVDGAMYQVRKFGLNGQVYEEHLIPIPTEVVTRVFKADGTEDEAKRTSRSKG